MKWTENKIKLLVKKYPNTDNQELADFFGCTVAALYVQASKFGLKKSPDSISKTLRKNGLNQRKNKVESKQRAENAILSKVQILELREDEILQWLSENQPSHSDYDNKIRELNIVQTKIYIATYEPPTRETSGIKEHSINRISTI